jgi:hypothetical protein
MFSYLPVLQALTEKKPIACWYNNGEPVACLFSNTRTSIGDSSQIGMLDNIFLACSISIRTN